MGYLVLEEFGEWWAYLKASDIEDLEQKLTKDYKGELSNEEKTARVIVFEYDMENVDVYNIKTESRYILELDE